jgi:hypothetical protein
MLDLVLLVFVRLVGHLIDKVELNLDWWPNLCSWFLIVKGAAQGPML